MRWGSGLRVIEIVGDRRERGEAGEVLDFQIAVELLLDRHHQVDVADRIPLGNAVHRGVAADRAGGSLKVAMTTSRMRSVSAMGLVSGRLRRCVQRDRGGVGGLGWRGGEIAMPAVTFRDEALDGEEGGFAADNAAGQEEGSRVRSRPSV